MVDNDDRIAVSPDVRQPFVQDAPAKQVDRQTMFGRGSESAVQTGVVRLRRQALAHSYANPAGTWCGRPFRHHIVDRWIGGVDRRHNPKLIRIGVVNFERVARIVFIGAERRHHDRTVDADTVHRSDHLFACGGLEAVRGTGPRPTGMISIEGMNLNVDDWHGRPPLLFDQLSVIVTGLHRVMSVVTGGAGMENIETERKSIEVRTLAFFLAMTLARDARDSQTVRELP